MDNTDSKSLALKSAVYPRRGQRLTSFGCFSVSLFPCAKARLPGAFLAGGIPEKSLKTVF